MVGLAVATAGLGITMPGDPLVPQLAATAMLLAWAGAIRVFLRNRSTREKGLSLGTMAVVGLMLTLLVGADLGGHILTSKQLPYEVVLLILTRDAALTTLVLSGNLVCLRLSGGLSVAVMLFSSVITEHRLIHPLMIGYSLIGGYWLILLNWSQLEIKLVEGMSSRPPIVAVLVWGLLAGLFTVSVVGPRQALGVLAEWLATSGGTTRGDEDTRSGVGDGPNLVKGTERAQSTGPTDSDVFLETQERSLYDASNEKWGEPEKRINRDQSLAVAVESDLRENTEEKAKQPNPAREFSVVRKRPRNASPPPSIAASSAYFLKGETPVHISQVTFDSFDGRRWAQPVFRTESLELAAGFGGWLQLPPSLSQVWAGDRDYRVIVGKIDSPLVPLPSYTSGFRIDKVDRSSFFRIDQPGIVTFRSDAGLPRQTAIEVRTRSVDPAKLRSLPFREGARYALPRFLTLREDQPPGERPPSAEPLWKVDPRVPQLARNWAGDRPRGWNQVEAIRDALRANYRYERGAVLPVDTRDAVATFLFDQHRGNDYAFATAACFLLRSLGYPCRFVEGLYVPSGRSDPVSGQTPVRMPEDLHVWAEVMTPGGDWVVVDPTPGYEVLGPRQTVFARVWGSLDVLTSRLMNHPVVVTEVALAAVVAFVCRRRIARTLASLAWRLEFRGAPRRRVVATLRLLERHARIAGRRRPVGITPRRWYPEACVAIDGPTRQSLDGFLRMADWAIFAPPELPPPEISVEIGARCRVFARSCALSWFVPEPSTKWRHQLPRGLNRVVALGLIGLGIHIHTGNSQGASQEPPPSPTEPRAVSDLPELPANVWAGPPESVSKPAPSAPRVASKFRRLDPYEEMSSVERINDLTMQGLTAAWFFVMGVSIGSFLNVVIYRVPRGLSVWGRRSHCPRCGVGLSFRENMPIIGWLRLKGRCATCRERISLRYPLVELATGLIVLALLQLELLTGGTSIPVREPNAYAGVVWVIWYPKWDLIGLFLYHFLLLATLLCAALIAWDGQGIPKGLTILVGLVGVISPLILPWLHPVPPFIERPTWFSAFGFGPGELVTAILGGMVGALAGAWMSPGRRAGGLATSLGLAGIYLGWQAATSIALMTALLKLISRAVFTRRSSDRSDVALGAVATLVQVLFWRSLAGHSSTLALAGTALLVIVVGMLKRAPLPYQRSEAQERCSPVVPDSGPQWETGSNHSGNEGP